MTAFTYVNGRPYAEAKGEKQSSSGRDGEGHWAVEVESLGQAALVALVRGVLVPGTLNAKAEPTPVEIADDDGPRYAIEDLGRFAAPVDSRTKTAVGVALDAPLPQEKFDALYENDERFRKTWDAATNPTGP